MLISLIIRFLTKIFFFTGKLSGQNAFLKPLSSREEAECFQELKKGSKEAEEKLIKHNLRLVAHIVKKYRSCPIDQDELISVGSIGLMKAVKTYDVNKGRSFSTYASRCIQNEILMLLRSEKKFQQDISIGDPIGLDKDGNEINLIDVLADNSPRLEDKAETQVMFEKVIKMIESTLPAREKEIIYLRYGIGYEKAYTQNEIAKRLGISRSYISRIEKKVLEKLREMELN